jgi:toxin CcdB
MAQFDLFVNPVPRARAAYPFVVAMQSNVTHDSREQIVAPLVPRESILKTHGRLTPIVEIDHASYVVLVPAMTVVRSREFPPLCGSIAAIRTELLAAIDYLFFGA